MKIKHINKIMIGMAVICCLHCLGEDYRGIDDNRKQSQDGSILAKYDWESTNKPVPGFELTIHPQGKEHSKLKINGLEFIDAKLNQKNDKLAVVYYDGGDLRYDCFDYTNNSWELKRVARLTDYNLAVEKRCNRIELENFDTVRASFIPADQTMRFMNGSRKRGVEAPGDLIFHFRVIPREGQLFAKVLINDKERKPGTWRPDLKSGNSSTETNAPPKTDK